MLGEIEEHLNCTISQVEPDIKVPVDDFDGKVTYGQKRALGGKQWTTLELVYYVVVVCCIMALLVLCYLLHFLHPTYELQIARACVCLCFILLT